MAVLKEHEVYEVVHGRAVDARDRAVPDVIAAGLEQLPNGSSKNPIAEFNQQFERLRERRLLTPIFESQVFQAHEAATAMADNSTARTIAEESSVENQGISENTNSPAASRTACRGRQRS